MSNQVIGIMGAEDLEVQGIIDLLENHRSKTIGMRQYHLGSLQGKHVVVTISRSGKVAAATTISALIHEFKITSLVFTGVAGALHPDLNVGDVVIGQRLVQHDVDARPFRDQFEIPILGKTFFESDSGMLSQAKDAITHLLDKEIQRIFNQDIIEEFHLHRPSLMVGDIASGDQFIASDEKRENLLSLLPSILCVEMEGAAVAQICYEYGIPFTVIRTISDTANNDAGVDFMKFLEQVASKYSVEILLKILGE